MVDTGEENFHLEITSILPLGDGEIDFDVIDCIPSGNNHID